jgi:Alcohol dehydrogenase, class IV
MPSTSGTGAEVTDIAVFSTGDSKDAITDPLMIADYAIADPFYTYSLPSKVAAASGVDALTHAIESFTSVEATPLTDTLAAGAIEKIYRNIREAVWDKTNYAAKDELSLGSLMAD